MKEETEKIVPGLRPLEEDDRDYSHSVVFGALPKYELPDKDFVVSTPLGIKDQADLDFCAAYAACAVSEDQEGVLLNPEYLFMKSKVLSGDPKNWGQDLRKVCQAIVKFGVIEQQYFPYLNRPQERDFYVDPKNWSDELYSLSYEHRKNSFFKVDGPYDTFDNFRGTLWQNRKESRSILTGALWRGSWTKMPGGIIKAGSYEHDEKGFGHAFKIFGQATIDGVMYLVAQLSNGIDIGDNGLFYFDRETVNSEFKFGAFTFKDMGKDEARYHAENKISIKDRFCTKFWKVGKTLISSYFNIKV